MTRKCCTALLIRVLMRVLQTLLLSLLPLLLLLLRSICVVQDKAMEEVDKKFRWLPHYHDAEVDLVFGIAIAGVARNQMQTR